jgi:hypothetical protein
MLARRGTAGLFATRFLLRGSFRKSEQLVLRPDLAILLSTERYRRAIPHLGPSRDNRINRNGSRISLPVAARRRRPQWASTY